MRYVAGTHRLRRPVEGETGEVADDRAQHNDNGLPVRRSRLRCSCPVEHENIKR